MHSEAPVFANKIDRHLRPREDPFDLWHLHGRCIRQYNTPDWPHAKLDLGLLRSSREAYSAAKKALYASNVFSFSSLNALQYWIAKIPPGAQISVQSIHLELQWVEGYVGNPTRLQTRHHKDLCLWRKFLDEDFTVQLPNIRELHINILLDGPITCWREVHGSDLTQMFLPLRRLRDLKRKNLTVTLAELSHQCPLLDSHHARREHSLGHGVTFWERKEIRRQWAEEIRELIPE